METLVLILVDVVIVVCIVLGLALVVSTLYVMRKYIAEDEPSRRPPEIKEQQEERSPDQTLEDVATQWINTYARVTLILSILGNAILGLVTLVGVGLVL